jgi:molecular chaperone GrpE
VSGGPAAKRRKGPPAGGPAAEAAREAAAVESEQAAAGDAANEAAEDEPTADAEERAIDEAAEGPSADEAAEQAEDPHARAERERAEYLALAQRTQADFENYRKRVAKDISAAGARAKAAVVRELLPAIDNLERALVAAGDGEASLAEGVRLVHSELVAALERNGVEGFEPTGEAFDPTLHEAMSTRPGDGAEAGVVLDVVERGYRLDGTVLRPARVVVSA